MIVNVYPSAPGLCSVFRELVNDDDAALPLANLLISLYDCPKRHYHTLSHVCYMLSMAGDPLGWELSQAEILAILFHDCVYVPGYERNELRSAQVMLAAMSSIVGDHNAAVAAAFGIIEDTSLFLSPEKAQERSHRVMDLDLLSLGNPDEEDWKRDRANIEKELGCTPKVTAAFFKLLLMRDKLFFTPGLDEWEKRAREKMYAYIGEHGA